MEKYLVNSVNQIRDVRDDAFELMDRQGLAFMQKQFIEGLAYGLGYTASHLHDLVNTYLTPSTFNKYVISMFNDNVKDMERHASEGNGEMAYYFCGKSCGIALAIKLLRNNYVHDSENIEKLLELVPVLNIKKADRKMFYWA